MGWKVILCQAAVVALPFKMRLSCFQYIDKNFGRPNQLFPSEVNALDRMRYFMLRIDSIPMMALTYGTAVFHTDHVTECLRYDRRPRLKNGFKKSYKETDNTITVGARIPNAFGIWMIEHIRFRSQPFKIWTMVNLGRFIHKEKCFSIKNDRAYSGHFECLVQTILKPNKMAANWFL